MDQTSISSAKQAADLLGMGSGIALSHIKPWSNPLAQPNSAAAAAKAAKAANDSVTVMTLTFLRELNSHPKGLDSDVVQRLLGAEHPKGIGSKLGMINNCLLHNGFKQPDEIYTSLRHPIEGRTWYPGPSITDAIMLLERANGEVQNQIFN